MLKPRNSQVRPQIFEFRRFARIRCNEVSHTGPRLCHGSFQGRGGLRLSLFGHDPSQDFRALTHEASGRRVNRVDPSRSLLLLKPTGEVPHEGGRRFTSDSWEYQVIRAWIEQGAARQPGSGAVETIAIEPAEHLFSGPGDTMPLRVNVTFRDGKSADMTPFCEFRARDDSIAEVMPSGQVRSIRPGVTAIIATFRGVPASATVLVPVVAAPESSVAHHHEPIKQATTVTTPRPASFIDQAVFAPCPAANRAFGPFQRCRIPQARDDRHDWLAPLP